MTDQQQTTALALRERMRAGELSALDVVNAYIQQVEARESEIQAFSWFDAGYARQQAEQFPSRPMSLALWLE